MKENFYQYQKNRTRILLLWGLSNAAGGIAGSWFNKSEFWRQFWLQALVWGAIDAVIAVFGLHSANKKLSNHQLSQAVVNKDIRFFHRLLFINAFLDISYMLAGLAIRQWRRFDQEKRNGIGAAFVVQGLFLFVYDSLLAREVKHRWLT